VRWLHFSEVPPADRLTKQREARFGQVRFVSPTSTAESWLRTNCRKVLP
jgi:hypothetical protein